MAFVTDATIAALVKNELAGDTTSNFPSGWDTTLEGIVHQVRDEVDKEIATARGLTRPFSFVADSVASERFFNTMRGLTDYLPIDDCTEVDAVKVYSPPGNFVRTLALGTDYYPKQSVPIVGIYASGYWPGGLRGGIGVTAKWGFGTDTPSDAIRCYVVETVRAYVSARAGDDDRIGSHVFGTVVINKAWTGLTQRLISRYSYGGAQAR